jgi:hypothetical protein
MTSDNNKYTTPSNPGLRKIYFLCLTVFIFPFLFCYKTEILTQISLDYEWLQGSSGPKLQLLRLGMGQQLKDKIRFKSA